MTSKKASEFTYDLQLAGDTLSESIIGILQHNRLQNMFNKLVCALHAF